MCAHTDMHMHTHQWHHSVGEANLHNLATQLKEHVWRSYNSDWNEYIGFVCFHFTHWFLLPMEMNSDCAGIKMDHYLFGNGKKKKKNSKCQQYERFMESNDVKNWIKNLSDRWWCLKVSRKTWREGNQIRDKWYKQDRLNQNIKTCKKEAIMLKNYQVKTELMRNTEGTKEREERTKRYRTQRGKNVDE